MYGVLCVFLFVYASCKFFEIPSVNRSSHVGRIFFLILTCLCLRWAYFGRRTNILLRSKYPKYSGSGNKFNRYALKIQLLRKKLEILKCHEKESIDSIINVLKYEAALPVYQPTWHKVFSALFFLILGAFISFFMDIADKNDLTPLWNLMKVAMTLLLMLIAIIFALEVTLGKLVYDWKTRSRYQMELIRFLEEIKLNMNISAKAAGPEITNKPPVRRS